MNTEKQKAIDIVGKYKDLVTTWDCYWDRALRLEETLDDQKKCALIQIHDQIELLVELKENAFGEDSYGKFIMDASIGFLQRVKTEIENLTAD